MNSTRSAHDSLAPNSIPQPGELVADKYQVEGVLGSGGMGVVLSARHVSLGQPVAIKVLTLPDEKDRASATERFLREGRATASLDSEHVVRVHDVGTLPTGAPFLVMELLRGLDLSELLTRTTTLPVEEAVDYVMQACAGVGVAHSRGIVHRDLKPSNLFLCQRDEGLWVKVLDFGISKMLGGDTGEGRLTGTRSTLGSPFYMSPEQVRDPKAVDFRGDVWALGVILHELLSGAPAFDGASLSGVCAAIVADPPAALRLKRPDVPPALEAVVLKCLEKDPARRYQTALELRAALEPFLPAKSLKRKELPVMFPELLTGTELTTAPTVHILTDSGNTLPSAILHESGERALSARTPGNALLIEAPRAPASAGRAPSADLQPSAELSSSADRSPSTNRGATVLDPHPAGAKSSGRTPVLVALGLGALILTLLGVFWVRHQSAQSAAQAVSATAPSRHSFTLSIDSNPTGADVFEGPNQLGTTPVRISIDAASVAQAPRVFTLRMAGRVPYTLVQGNSEDSVRVVAELSAQAPHEPVEPPPSRAEAPAARPAPSTPPMPAPRAVQAPRHQTPPTAPAPKPAASPDIRLQR